MIVSHQHRFIYLRTEKTGSTALEAALVGALDGEGEDWQAALTPPLARRLPAATGGLKRRLPQLFGLHKHAKAAQVRAVLGAEVWGSYYKFAVERNPWARQVSLYYHRRSRQPGAALDFDAAMRSPLYNLMHYNRLDNWHVYAIGETLAADQVIRYEDLAESLPPLFARLGLPAPALERKNQAAAGARDHYSRYYTAQSRALVGRWYAREITAFGYRFEAAPALAESAS